jgi:predicted nucleic acid-binding protein
VSLVVVDTDVASTLLRRRASDTLARQLTGHTIAITFVTYGELTKWTLVRRWGPRSLDTMRTFLAELVVLPYDQRVATRWGEIQAYAQLRGRPRPTNDSWIAACCLVRELPLATFNTKDFADFRRARGPRTRPLRTLSVECLVERTTAHRRAPETQDANTKPR